MSRSLCAFENELENVLPAARQLPYVISRHKTSPRYLQISSDSDHTFLHSSPNLDHSALHKPFEYGGDYEAREQHAGIVLLHCAEQKYADQQWAVSVSEAARCLQKERCTESSNSTRL